MLYQQHREGDVNPARLMNAFIDSEEQREVSSLFNATIHLETPEEQNRAFSDTVLRIKDESLKERNRTWDPTDMQGLQEIVKAKKEITLLASDYLPETFDLSAEMTAKQLSNGYLHCVTDDRWHAGNGI